MKCPVCAQGGAGVVKKDHCFLTKEGFQIFSSVPTITCRNNDCGEESFSVRVARAISIARKREPSFYAQVPVFYLIKRRI